MASRRRELKLMSLCRKTGEFRQIGPCLLDTFYLKSSDLQDLREHLTEEAKGIYGGGSKQGFTF